MFQKIDLNAAYNKGNPICSVDQIGSKLETVPMDAEWISNIENMPWYHKNNDITPYVNRDSKNGHRMFELREKLLSFGGQEVCLPIYEDDLADILDRGQFWFGDRITMKRGLPSQCHLNSCRCWNANKDKTVLCTGYALSKDSMWRQHSWCIHVKPRINRVVETTVERIAYFGFVMTTEEAEKFYDDTY